MRPIPASNDASRGICDENRPVPQQRACFSSQVPDYPIPLNDCSLVLPPLSEYEEEANERRRAGSGGNDGNRGGPAEAPTESREARQLHMIRQDRFTEQKHREGDPGKVHPSIAHTRARKSASTATARCPMPVPHDFWTVLQKMGPDFDMSLGFWAVCCGHGSLQTSPTWGNADAPRPFKPKPPAKPPRSRIARARGTSNDRGHRAQTVGAGNKPGHGPSIGLGTRAPNTITVCSRRARVRGQAPGANSRWGMGARPITEHRARAASRA